MNASKQPALVFDGGLLEAFEAFHAAHPAVYDELARVARSVKAKGFKRYGIKACFEVVRYHRMIEGLDGVPKLNNSLTAYYARRLMDSEPDLAGFFETRELRAA